MENKLLHCLYMRKSSIQTFFLCTQFKSMYDAIVTRETYAIKGISINAHWPH